MILPEDENFLLIFRREAPLDNSVEFMKVNLYSICNIFKYHAQFYSVLWFQVVVFFVMTSKSFTFPMTDLEEIWCWQQWLHISCGAQGRCTHMTEGQRLSFTMIYNNNYEVWILRILFCLFLYFWWQGFLKDLFQQHKKDIPPRKLDEYTNTMVTLLFLILPHLLIICTNLCMITSWQIVWHFFYTGAMQM